MSTKSTKEQAGLSILEFSAPTSSNPPIEPTTTPSELPKTSLACVTGSVRYLVAVRNSSNTGWKILHKEGVLITEDFCSRQLESLFKMNNKNYSVLDRVFHAFLSEHMRDTIYRDW